MRSAETVLSELGDLASALSGFENREFEAYSGPWLMREDLERRRTELIEELGATLHERSTPVLAFLIEGGPATSDSVRAGFLGQMLIHLQEAIYSLVQAANGAARLTGGFSEDVIRAGTVRVSGMARGSYGVILEGPALPIQESLIAGDIADRPALDTSLSQIFELLDVAGHHGTDEILLGAALNTAPRALAHIKDIAGYAATSGARLKLNWRSPTSEPRYVELGQVDAKRLSDALQDIESVSREEEILGTLVELSMIRDRFTIALQDNTLRRGTVDPAIRESLAGYMNRPCRAQLITTITRSKATGRLREAGHLISIDAP